MNVLLIDDHPLILTALQTLVQGLDEHVSVVPVVSASAARETLAANADFDIALLVLQLGDDDGFELLVELRGLYPALPIVIVDNPTPCPRHASPRSTRTYRQDSIAIKNVAIR